MSNVRAACPFCGSKPIMKRKHSATGTMYRMECHGKHCDVKPITMTWAPDTLSALRFWNRRKGAGSEV